MLRNAGNVTLSGPFTVADDTSSTESCPATTTLPPGLSITCTATYVATQDDVNNGFITNKAVAYGFFDGDPVPSNEATKTISGAKANLVIFKTAPTETLVNDEITFHITVKNLGPDDALSVVMNDAIPAGTSFLSATPSQGACDITVSCELGTIAADGEATIDIVVKVNNAGMINNTATVSASELDPDKSDNQAETQTVAKLRPTTLVYNGDLTGDYHDQATMSATLTDSTTGALIEGKPIVFTLDGGENCTGTTDATGTATCVLIPERPAGAYPLVAEFTADSTYDASSDDVDFVVTRKETEVQYTGAHGPILNGSTDLSGVLKEDGVTPIEGRDPLPEARHGRYGADLH